MLGGRLEDSSSRQARKEAGGGEAGRAGVLVLLPAMPGAWAWRACRQVLQQA